MRLVIIDFNLKLEIVILNSDGTAIESVEVSTKDIETPQGIESLTRRIREKVDCENDRVLIKRYDYKVKGRNTGLQLALGWVIQTILTEQGVQYTEVSADSLESEKNAMFKLV